jgi:DNA-directed RNA polymerase subunit RPC12/RpoP
LNFELQFLFLNFDFCIGESMAQEADFKCLRCGHQFKLPFDPTGPMVERACPKCLSNSVRRQKEEQKK